MAAWVWNGEFYEYSNTPQVNPYGTGWVPLFEGWAWNGDYWEQFYPDFYATQVTDVEMVLSGACGGDLTVTGRVTDHTGEIPMEGSVTFYWRESYLAAWNEGGTVTVQPDGSFTLVQSPWRACGTALCKVSYGGDKEWGAADFIGLTPDNGLVAPVLTGGTITNTSAAFSWTAVPCADMYEVWEGDRQIATVSGRSYTHSSLGQGTRVSYRVRARSASGCVGEYSEPLSGRTGRPEILDTGSKTGLVFAPDETNTWRKDKGWGFHGDLLAQSYPTSSSQQAKGVIDFGKNNISLLLMAYLTDPASPNFGLGMARILGGHSTKATVRMQRRSGGPASPPVRFYTSMEGARNPGGISHDGPVKSVTASAVGAVKDYEIGRDLSAALAQGARSLVLYATGTGNYCMFQGESYSGLLGSCWLTINWSWSYPTQAGITPHWDT